MGGKEVKATKKDLVSAVSIKAGISMKEANKAVDDFLERLRYQLTVFDVIIKCFGKFAVVTKKERKNKLNGKVFIQPQQKVVRFYPSKKFVASINNGTCPKPQCPAALRFGHNHTVIDAIAEIVAAGIKLDLIGWFSFSQKWDKGKTHLFGKKYNPVGKYRPYFRAGKRLKNIG